MHSRGRNIRAQVNSVNTIMRLGKDQGGKLRTQKLI